MWVANAVVPNAAVAVLLLDTLASFVPALGGGAVRIGTLFAVYAPGRALAPLGASAIIVWMLSTLPVKELGAVVSIVAVSGLAYTLQRFGQRASAHRETVAT